jgi:nitrogen regulatory protein PII
MKLVTAIIKPFKLDEVREALSAIGVQGFPVRRWAADVEPRTLLEKHTAYRTPKWGEAGGPSVRPQVRTLAH